jgi:rod shape-determining protein MreC
LYRISRIKPKYIAAVFLFILLIFLPFKDTIQRIVTFFSHKPFFLSQSKYQRQISELKKKNLELELELKEFNQLKEENEKLRKAVSLEQQEAVTLLGAEIIAFIPSSWRRLALLNKGAAAGLSEGLFVIDEGGNLLGKIHDVKKNSSHLIFIDDPDFAVPVYISEKSFGLLKGNLIGAKILYIEDASDIKIGDTVWVKAVGLLSPVNIGEVKAIKKNVNDLFWDIDVELTIKDTFFDKVFIIK